MPTPHYLRFARALALVSTAAATAGCGGSTTSADASADVALPYDGVAVGVAPYDGGERGLSTNPDAQTPVVDAAVDSGVPIYDGAFVGADVPPEPYDGRPVGVAPLTDAQVDDTPATDVPAATDVPIIHGVIIHLDASTD